jgi:hypothetical protein
MWPRLVLQAEITKLAFAFDCRIKLELASSGIEPQKVEPFFAAKLGAQNQTV